MAKKNSKRDRVGMLPEKQDMVAQNKAPVRQYPNFEAFWYANVQNGKNIHLQSCRAHLKALGLLNKPESWRDAVRHFGIPIEE